MARLSWTQCLVTYQGGLSAVKMVTHPDTNWTWHRVTLSIETIMLLLMTEIWHVDGGYCVTVIITVVCRFIHLLTFCRHCLDLWSPPLVTAWRETITQMCQTSWYSCAIILCALPFVLISFLGRITAVARCRLLLPTECHGLSVCLSVGHVCELCKNSRTNQDTSCRVDSVGLNEPCITEGPDAPKTLAIFVVCPALWKALWVTAAVY